MMSFSSEIGKSRVRDKMSQPAPITKHRSNGTIFLALLSLINDPHESLVPSRASAAHQSGAASCGGQDNRQWIDKDHPGSTD